MANPQEGTCILQTLRNCHAEATATRAGAHLLQGLRLILVDLYFIFLIVQERHRKEVAEQDFEKASKTAAAEQARKDREQARVKEQQEVQQRLAAHKQGVKAARTRIDRAALHSLGEAFAARLQVTLLIMFAIQFGPAPQCRLSCISTCCTL